MIISSLKIQFPDKCPENCPHIDSIPIDGPFATCLLCPLMCTTGESTMLFVSREDYREDWTIKWKKWFDNGMVGLIGLDGISRRI